MKLLISFALYVAVSQAINAVQFKTARTSHMSAMNIDVVLFRMCTPNRQPASMMLITYKHHSMTLTALEIEKSVC